MARPDACDLQVVNEKAVSEILREQAAEDELADLAETFQLLAAPARLRIVEALGRGELCVCDLAAVSGVSSSAVSHHLRQLRQMRIVRFRKVGRMAYYRLNDEHIAHLFRTGLEHVRE